MKSIVAAVLVGVASIAAAQSQSSEAEKQEANQVRLRCIYKYSMQLDDGSTLVETVAKAASSSCRRESIEFVNVLTMGVNVDKQRVLTEVMQVSNTEAATYYILTSRKERK